jgi:hypothetical protein
MPSAIRGISGNSTSVIDHTFCTNREIVYAGNNDIATYRGVCVPKMTGSSSDDLDLLALRLHFSLNYN